MMKMILWKPSKPQRTFYQVFFIFSIILKKVRSEAKKLGKSIVSKKFYTEPENIVKKAEISYIQKSVVREFFISGEYLKIPDGYRISAYKRFCELKEKVNETREKMRKDNIKFEKSQSFIDMMDIKNYTKNKSKIEPDYEKIVKISEIIIHDTITNLLDIVKENSIKFDYNFGLWIFALLLIIEKPLVPDMSAELNDLLKFIIETKQNCTENLEIYDLLIIIIAEYYGQKPI